MHSYRRRLEIFKFDILQKKRIHFFMVLASGIFSETNQCNKCDRR